MRVIPLMIFATKVEETEILGRSRLNFPEQKRSDRKSLHETVEKLADLLRTPDKFSLDRRQYVVMLENTIKCGLDCNGGLIGHAGRIAKALIRARLVGNLQKRLSACFSKKIGSDIDWTPILSGKTCKTTNQAPTLCIVSPRWAVRQRRECLFVWLVASARGNGGRHLIPTFLLAR